MMKVKKKYKCVIINPERIPFACEQYEKVINEMYLNKKIKIEGDLK